MYAITSTSWRAVASVDDAQAGETVVTIIPQSLTRAMRILDIRRRRDAQLRSSDWTQANDSPLLVADKEAWATYRAALRSLPQQPGFPDVEWPRPPNMADGTADQPDPSTKTPADRS